MKPYVHMYTFSLRISKLEAHEQWSCTLFGSQKDSWWQIFYVLTLREEHRLRVFENRVLRRIFGLKRHEIMIGWGKQHNQNLHTVLFVRYNQVGDDEVGRVCSMYGEEWECLQGFGEKVKGEETGRKT
jgi:hypothetical protein